MRRKSSICIVTYYWPPGTGPGVYRWLQLSKYLVQEEIDLHVLTVKPSWASYIREDKRLLEQVDSRIRIHRTCILDPFVLVKVFSFGSKAKNFNSVKKTGILWKLLNYVRSNFFVPDAKIGWNYFAVKKARRIIEQFDVRTFVTTGPPHSTHLIGLKLKEQEKINWISDFRDPWNGIFYEEQFMFSKKTKIRHLALEKKVLNESDAVLCVGPSLRKKLVDSNENQHHEKFLIVPNGYDPDLYANLTPKTGNSNEITICYAGTITAQYECANLIRSIAIYRKSTSRRILLQFIGTVDMETRQLIKQEGLDEVTEFTGILSHGDTIKAILQSDILLLAIPEVNNNELIITGKLFEYLGTSRPVIGIGPKEGDASKIISECQVGKMFDRTEVLEITDFFMSMENRSFIIPHNSQRLNYSRKVQASALVESLNDMGLLPIE